MNRKGFTLIELLIVVVIIGILAAIAIPKFANTKEKAYIASMKSDLRNLVTAEEAYFADSAVYTANWSCATPTPAANVAFCTSAGVGVAPGQALTIAVTPTGWNAIVGHNATAKKCDIYVGATAAGGGVANKEGEPKCQ
ncbi:MAG TPA: prepilin-type N-terminal cleavage/methylation domain-containing protein [Gemmatimonadales bacterium]|nr:prepilin-type N-terminal cleavage/methylation domain-containing protein [Gemmatimonadales bacterium]